MTEWMTGYVIFINISSSGGSGVDLSSPMRGRSQQALGTVLPVGRMFVLQIDLENKTSHDINIFTVEIELQADTFQLAHMSNTSTAAAAAAAAGGANNGGPSSRSPPSSPGSPSSPTPPVDSRNSTPHSTASFRRQSFSFYAQSLFGAAVGQDGSSDNQVNPVGSGFKVRTGEKISTVFHIVPRKLGTFQPGLIKVFWARAAHIEQLNESNNPASSSSSNNNNNSASASASNSAISIEIANTNTRPTDDVAAIDSLEADAHVVDLACNIPSCHIVQPTFDLAVERPQTCEIHSYFPLSISITNRSSNLQQVVLSASTNSMLDAALDIPLPSSPSTMFSPNTSANINSNSTMSRAPTIHSLTNNNSSSGASSSNNSSSINNINNNNTNNSNNTMNNSNNSNNSVMASSLSLISPWEEKGAQVCFSGRRSGILSILPGATEVLRYHVCPLEYGYVALPKVHLIAKETAAPLWDPHDLGFVFVLPKRLNQ